MADNPKPDDIPEVTPEMIETGHSVLLEQFGGEAAWWPPDLEARVFSAMARRAKGLRLCSSRDREEP
jgi:hypothetical protein